MDINFRFQTKEEYRQFAKKMRASLDISHISNAICDILTSQKFYVSAENILIFYPFGTEINLKKLYTDTGKKWTLPRVENNFKDIVIHKYKIGDDLVKNKWGICEPLPDSEQEFPDNIDLAIIPALMADRYGFRLGYGAGYYDKFIPKLRNDCIKIVPLPHELLVNTLPGNDHDIPVDFIITEHQLIDCNH